MFTLGNGPLEVSGCEQEEKCGDILKAEAAEIRQKRLKGKPAIMLNTDGNSRLSLKEHVCGPLKTSAKKVFFDLSIRESRYSLQDNASKIKAPTEIIWGKCDKIFDPSGADILAKAIPHCQVNMLDRCGHFITMDRPQKSAELILEFHNSVCGAKKTN
uniref:Uncharacterized protein n=1 Tax=Sphaerodactylus townsendi TaxID=933632 RepID=A0ACB8EGE3_9SAUR